MFSVKEKSVELTTTSLVAKHFASKVRTLGLIPDFASVYILEAEFYERKKG